MLLYLTCVLLLVLMFLHRKQLSDRIEKLGERLCDLEDKLLVNEAMTGEDPAAAEPHGIADKRESEVKRDEHTY